MTNVLYLCLSLHDGNYIILIVIHPCKHYTSSDGVDSVIYTTWINKTTVIGEQRRWINRRNTLAPVICWTRHIRVCWSNAYIHFLESNIQGRCPWRLPSNVTHIKESLFSYTNSKHAVQPIYIPKNALHLLKTLHMRLQQKLLNANIHYIEMQNPNGTSSAVHNITSVPLISSFAIAVVLEPVITAPPPRQSIIPAGAAGCKRESVGKRRGEEGKTIETRC